MELQYDGTFNLATGKSRKETSWKNQEWNWSQFLEHIKETHRSAETVAEYKAADKARQDELKDVGGFVGGYIKGGRRKADNILFRRLLTLDIDFASSDVWETFCLLYLCAAAVYSTHKHTPESPRFRLIIPLSRDVTAEEYEAVARRVASVIGIDMFDDTTYEPSRFMYWPSTSKDGEYIFDYQDGPWLDADEVLAAYQNWKDASEWPVSSRLTDIVRRGMKRQGDPLDKPGIIGAFCRTYDIHQAIATFLPEEYTACAIENRYTYTKGSTAAGLVVYEDKFAYSHHGTDPTSGRLCNAFDLVRLHLYGDMDENSQTKDVTKLPSFKAMEELAIHDEAVKTLVAREKIASAAEDFIDADTEELDWMANMDINSKGKFLSTPKNQEMILAYDPNLKGKIAIDDFSGRVCVRGPLPWREKDDTEPLWRDDDESNLYLYISKEPYEIKSKGDMQDAIRAVSRKNAFHPVRDYLTGLSWDGMERLDSLFIDYLGVEDTEYTRAVTRKALCAGVARIFNPGCQFDYMIVLVGEQGVGKSKLLSRLAVNPSWFVDSFTVEGKEAAENIQGKWLVESAELSGMKKSEAAATKAFITRTQDYYRAAFERYTKNRPRQCIFFGTTNEYNFLRDDTGDRRFWPLEVRKERIAKRRESDLTDYELGQIWAEAVVRYREGEKLYLPEELEAKAREKQQQYSETDERVGVIQQYLETLLPTNWPNMDIRQRRSFLAGDDELSPQGSIVRTKVCVAEIWCECYGRSKGDLTRYEVDGIVSLMRKIPRWKRKSTTYRFPIYGTQRYFEKEESEQQEGVNDSICKRDIF